MNIFFSVLNPAYVRNFEPVVRLLAQRGHRIHFAFHERAETAELDPLVRGILADFPEISHSAAVDRDDQGWLPLAMRIRASIDYLQFLHPRYHETYLARAERRVPSTVRRVANAPVVKTTMGRALLGWGLRRIDDALPSSPEIERYIAELQPDVALFTPYVGLSTTQPDYLRSAQALGVRTAVCVTSWDNLSSKSLLHPKPDMVTVWNGIQKREAVELHGMPPGSVMVTGAQNFDHWFTWQPRPREEFCARVGLDPSRPFLCYTCFTPFKGGLPEPQFVDQWLRALRASADPDVRELGVLIRPHPKRVAEWRQVDVSRFGNVVIWPREGANPVSPDTRQDYFDSLHHSSAVVGLNTSALIEAGIVGRPVHTILVPEYWASQEGTLHFHYLMDVAGGLLRVARGMEQHLAQLSEVLRPGGWDGEENRRFVNEFVRPHGLDVPATPIFVDAVERLAARGAADPTRPALPLRMVRPLLLSAAQKLAAADPAKAKKAPGSPKARKKSPSAA